MAENRTKATTAGVDAYIATQPYEARRKDTGVLERLIAGSVAEVTRLHG